MELKENGILVDGKLIPFTEEQLEALRGSKKNDRLERLGFYESEGKYGYYLNGFNEMFSSSVVIKKSVDFRNSFNTLEHAEQEAKRREILNDLILNSDPKEEYQIIYNTQKEKFFPHYILVFPSLGQPPLTKEKAEEMIEKWGDDLKLLLYL